MQSIILLGYTCPQCGYLWGDAVHDDTFVSACECPSCETSTIARVVS